MRLKGCGIKKADVWRGLSTFTDIENMNCVLTSIAKIVILNMGEAIILDILAVIVI